MNSNDNSAYFYEELENIEGDRIQIEDIIEFHREALKTIVIELQLLKERVETSDEIKFRLEEKIEKRDSCESKIESYENKLKQVNEKLSLTREKLLRQQQVVTHQPSEIKTEPETTSETSYTAPQIQVTPDVIADQRLGTMEKTFRELIVKVLDLREPWHKDKIPSDIIRKVTEQRQKNNNLDDVEVPLVNELDFTHYKEIFIYNANWKLFKDVFVDRQGLETKLTELTPIRNTIAHHKRAITETESKRVDVYFDDIMKSIIRYEGK